MAVSVLLAEDAEIMRRAIRGLLADHAEIHLVGEATDFAQTIRMTADLKPQVLVMDLHISGVTPAGIKDDLHLGASRLLIISLSNDEEAKSLAETFGAAILLDKMNLYDELVPTILRLAKATAHGAAG